MMKTEKLLEIHTVILAQNMSATKFGAMILISTQSFSTMVTCVVPVAEVNQLTTVMMATMAMTTVPLKQ
jgi:hypothetical protein